MNLFDYQTIETANLELQKHHIYEQDYAFSDFRLDIANTFSIALPYGFAITDPADYGDRFHLALCSSDDLTAAQEVYDSERYIVMNNLDVSRHEHRSIPVMLDMWETIAQQMGHTSSPKLAVDESLNLTVGLYQLMTNHFMFFMDIQDLSLLGQIRLDFDHDPDITIEFVINWFQTIKLINDSATDSNLIH